MGIAALLVCWSLCDQYCRQPPDTGRWGGEERGRGCTRVSPMRPWWVEERMEHFEEVEAEWCQLEAALSQTVGHIQQAREVISAHNPAQRVGADDVGMFQSQKQPQHTLHEVVQFVQVLCPLEAGTAEDGLSQFPFYC